MMRFNTSSRRTSLLAEICCLLVLAPIVSLKTAPAALLPVVLQTWAAGGTEGESNVPTEEEGESEAIAHARCHRRLVELRRGALAPLPALHSAAQVAACFISHAASGSVVTEQQLKNGVGAYLRC